MVITAMQRQHSGVLKQHIQYSSVTVYMHIYQGVATRSYSTYSRSPIERGGPRLISCPPTAHNTLEA